MWRSCSTVVIYSGGLQPYLFSISLMLDSGFPPALPWPTGRRAWVGPLQNCLEPAPQTHSPLTSPPTALSLLLSPYLLPTSCTQFHNRCPTSSRTNTLRHSYLFTLTSSPPLVSLLLILALTLLFAIWHQLWALNHMQTSSHARPRTLKQTITHTHMDYIHCPPQPPFLQYPLSNADVMLANTLHFYDATSQNAKACKFYLCKFKLKLSSWLGGGGGKNPRSCVIVGMGQFVVVWVISPGFHCCFLQLFLLLWKGRQTSLFIMGNTVCRFPETLD